MNPYLIEFSHLKNPKMHDPFLVTLLKMRPHSSQSSHENATPSSGTSPLPSYKEVPPPPPPGDSDFKECPKRQNKPQNAQEYTRGESVLFILLNES